MRSVSRPAPATIALASIVVIGAALRLWIAPHHPDAFQQDEVVNGYDAYCLARTGMDHHGNAWPLLFESFGDWVSPLLTYVTIPFVALGGLSGLTIRLPGALANIAAIAVVSLAARAFTGSRSAGLAAAAVFATAPWDIALADWAAAPTLVPLLAAASLFFALRTIRTRGVRDALGLAIVCALAVYAYPTQKVIAPLTIAIALCLMRGWRERAITGATFALLAAPMLALTLSDPKYSARFAYLALDPHDPGFAAAVLGRYVEYLDPAFLFRHGDMSFALVLEPLFLLGIAFVVLAIVAPALVPQLARRDAAFIAALAVIAPLPASLTVDHQHLNRMVHVLPLVAVICGTGIALLGARFSGRGLRIAGAVALSICVAVPTIAFFLRFVNGRQITTGFSEPQTGLGDVQVAVEARFPSAPVVVDTNALNQPYIYYLFASRYDPAALPLAQMRASQTSGYKWAYVSAIGNVRYRPVDPQELAGAKYVTSYEEGPLDYELRERDGTLFLLP